MRPKSSILSSRLGSAGILNNLLTSSSGRGARPCATRATFSSLRLPTYASAFCFSRAIWRCKYARLPSSVLYASSASMMCSRLRETFAVPRLRLENDGGNAADEAAAEGWPSATEGVEGSVNVCRNEPISEFVRILTGSSSKIDENVNRWSIKLRSVTNLEMNAPNAIATDLEELKLFLFNASKNALVRRNARKDAFPRAVCDMSSHD